MKLSNEEVADLQDLLWDLEHKVPVSDELYYLLHKHKDLIEEIKGHE